MIVVLYVKLTGMKSQLQTEPSSSNRDWHMPMSYPFSCSPQAMIMDHNQGHKPVYSDRGLATRLFEETGWRDMTGPGRISFPGPAKAEYGPVCWCILTEYVLSVAYGL
ncbi:hypothetical protein J6590_058168 [Homalodisca vitripennis]|nr:hypothetical protein J6590_058168 [Homalodisca vitripennis]